MGMIKTWDWYYRIALDKDVLQEVNNFYQLLTNKEEREYYKNLIDFYQNFLQEDSTFFKVEMN